MPAGDQEFGIFAVKRTAFRLDVRCDRAAHIRTFVVIQAAFLHGFIDHIDSAFDQAALVGVLDAQNKSTVRMAGNQPGIERGAQVPYVHISRRRRGKTGADLPFRNPRFHIIKPCLFQLFRHLKILRFLSLFGISSYIILHFSCCQAQLILLQ